MSTSTAASQNTYKALEGDEKSFEDTFLTVHEAFTTPFIVEVLKTLGSFEIKPFFSLTDNNKRREYVAKQYGKGFLTLADNLKLPPTQASTMAFMMAVTNDALAMTFASTEPFPPVLPFTKAPKTPNTSSADQLLDMDIEPP